LEQKGNISHGLVVNIDFFPQIFFGFTTKTQRGGGFGIYFSSVNSPNFLSQKIGKTKFGVECK
jgi:hypothetical protein